MILFFIIKENIIIQLLIHCLPILQTTWLPSEPSPHAVSVFGDIIASRCLHSWSCSPSCGCFAPTVMNFQMQFICVQQQQLCQFQLSDLSCHLAHFKLSFAYKACFPNYWKHHLKGPLHILVFCIHLERPVCWPLPTMKIPCDVFH